VGRPRWTDRLTVEECRWIDVEAMRRDGVLLSTMGTRWWVVWKDPEGKTEATLGYSVVANPGGGISLRIDGMPMHGSEGIGFTYVIKIATSRPRFGGRRYWFRCPMVRNGTDCGRLVGRLYLPPGQEIFACRICHNLTYWSAQTHDKRVDRMMRDPDALLSALGGQDLNQALLAFQANTRLKERLKKRG
jgi:hypothetical protein